MEYICRPIHAHVYGNTYISLSFLKNKRRSLQPATRNGRHEMKRPALKKMLSHGRVTLPWSSFLLRWVIIGSWNRDNRQHSWPHPRLFYMQMCMAHVSALNAVRYWGWWERPIHKANPRLLFPYSVQLTNCRSSLLTGPGPHWASYNFVKGLNTNWAAYKPPKHSVKGLAPIIPTNIKMHSMFIKAS